MIQCCQTQNGKARLAEVLHNFDNVGGGEKMEHLAGTVEVLATKIHVMLR